MLDAVARGTAASTRPTCGEASALRLAEIDRELLEMEQRGHAFFDEMLRLGRVVDLLNRNRVQQEFERQVVSDTPRAVEARVNDLVDWMVDADLREWQAVTARLAERRRQYRDRLVGEAAGRRSTRTAPG